LATVALLAIVGVASRHPLTGGHPVRGQHGGGFGWFLDLLTGWMSLAVGFGLIAYLSALRPARRRRAFEPSRSRTIWLALVGAVLLELQLRYHLITFHHTRGASGGTAGPPPGALQMRKHPTTTMHLPWPVLVALAVVGVVLALVLLAGPGRYRGQGRGARLAEGEEGPDRLGHALAQVAWASLEDLAAESDPRRAVIAAYARMERGLREAGIPRAPADTPTEYLTRAFAVLPAGQDEAARLTAIYKEAHFSHHRVPETMRADAVAALGGLARALEQGAVANRAQTAHPARPARGPA
jgi:hypothetical protein